MNSPVVWSIWPSISTIARTAVSRSARAGCSAGNVRICASMSGEALNSTQSAPSAETTIDDWVRGTRADRALAHAGAVAAVAVPLREAAARGGAEHPDIHE